MHLSPRELDKLTLHQVGFVAQKRLARGLRLNHPEAVALIATVLLELIRDGKSVAELMDLDRKSTRLNSSHLVISYAVFCLKKKKTTACHTFAETRSSSSSST